MVKQQFTNFKKKFDKKINLNKKDSNPSFKKRKLSDSQQEEKTAERKNSTHSKSEDELEDINNSENEENKKAKKENLFDEKTAEKYENDNLILETPMQALRKKKVDKKAKGFRAFSLSPDILEGIKRMGYKNPTPIQRKCIPSIMSGFNIIAHSRTGSGKTAAFVLPILHRLKEHSKVVGARCLIVCPTRELAHQTMTFCKKLGKFANLKYALLVGGNELDGQFERLAQNPDIIIATPGRIMHHLVNIYLIYVKLIFCISNFYC